MCNKCWVRESSSGLFSSKSTVARGAKNIANCLPVVTVPAALVLPSTGRKGEVYLICILFFFFLTPVSSLAYFKPVSFSKSGIQPRLSANFPIPIDSFCNICFMLIVVFQSVVSVHSLLSHLRFLSFPLDCKLLKGKVSITAKLCKHRECAVNSMGTQ